MKTKEILLVLFITLTFLGSLSAQSKQFSIAGAWHIKEGENEHVLIVQDGFLFHAHYSKAGKKFISIQGGTYTSKEKEVSAKIYFSTANKEEVGKQLTGTFSVNGNIPRSIHKSSGREMEENR
jgi:hypothetical protein